MTAISAPKRTVIDTSHFVGIDLPLEEPIRKNQAGKPSTEG
jgi:hypothetical protein